MSEKFFGGVVTFTSAGGSVSSSFGNTSSDEKMYTITLDNNAATVEGTTAIYERYGSGIYLTSNSTNAMTLNTNEIAVPTKDGYTFLGYYTDQILSGSYQANLDRDKAGSSSSGSSSQYLYCESYDFDILTGMYNLSNCELSAAENFVFGKYTCQSSTNTSCSTLYEFRNVTGYSASYYSYGSTRLDYNTAAGTQLINANGYITSDFSDTKFSSNTILYAKWAKN